VAVVGQRRIGLGVPLHTRSIAARADLSRIVERAVLSENAVQIPLPPIVRLRLFSNLQPFGELSAPCRARRGPLSRQKIKWRAEISACLRDRLLDMRRRLPPFAQVTPDMTVFGSLGSRRVSMCVHVCKT